MFHIDDEEINKIRNNADIVEIVSSYIPLEAKGKNYFGVCPFHEDHSPSMSVSKEKGIYKCFSCGATGNVFKFVSDYENISFPKAVQKIAELIGMPIKGIAETKKIKKNQEEYKIMELSSLFFQNNLQTQKGLEAVKYLKDRGLEEETIKQFQIGLSLDKTTLTDFLKSRKYDSNQMKNLGLINQTATNTYDTFINRIMFPIHNLEGQVIGFTGRIYKDDSPPPKYLNSKETIIFKKGNILFNYHRAKDAIRLEKKVIIVEGNMDAIRMTLSGIKNTIALMGTSLTSFQIKELKKLRVPIILMLDNDSSGATATYQIGNLLEKENMTVQVVRLSGEKDPDEYILKQGIEAMKNNIKNAISFLEFKVSYLKKDKNLKDSKELANYVKAVLNDMKEIDDAILKEITLKKMSEDYNISFNILKQELEKIEEKKEEEKIIVSEKLEPPKKKTRYTEGVNHILYFMMHSPIYIKMYKNKLGFLNTPVYRGIANEIMAYYENHKTINFADFLSYIEKSKLKNEMLEIIHSIKDENMDETIMEEYITSVKKAMKQEEIKRLIEEQKQEMDENKKLKIGSRIQTLKKEV